jgi:hypothetical protein
MLGWFKDEIDCPTGLSLWLGVLVCLLGCASSRKVSQPDSQSVRVQCPERGDAGFRGKRVATFFSKYTFFAFRKVRSLPELDSPRADDCPRRYNSPFLKGEDDESVESSSVDGSDCTRTNGSVKEMLCVR